MRRRSQAAATASSAAVVEVATMTSSTSRVDRAARTTQSRTGRPPSGSSTFPGSRLEPARAWMTATTRMALLR